MIRIKLLPQTFTFRLAFVYVGLFSISVIILFAFIYGSAMRYLEQQAEDSIKARYTQLLNEYHDNGSVGVEERIKELTLSDEEGIEIYLLTNRESEKLAGNMESWPKYAKRDSKFGQSGEWIQFFIEGSRTTPDRIEVKALSISLSKWRTLLVGQSLQNHKRIEQTIIQAFWTSLIITIIMAFFGAFVITKSVVRRINIINRSANKIMHGQISARIPTTKGGDEFDELSSNLNQMLDKIETLLKSLSDFANNIAHDLRTPLNRIIARTETGLRKLEPNSPNSSLLNDNIIDMQELIATFNSILRISELEANKESQALSPLDLASILTKMTEFYEPYALEKNIIIKNSIAQKLWINGEKHLLTQAFANLIDNAIKFAPEGSCITVDGAVYDTVTIVTIADNGPGIAEEMRQKVFEKFYRLEQSRSNKGNGLGLSLVEAVMRIHNSKIILGDNSPGLKVSMEFSTLAVPDETIDFKLV